MGGFFSVHLEAKEIPLDSASHSKSEPGFPSSPQSSTFPEAAGASAEAQEVLALHISSQLMRITNFSHKLDSLCQAFTNQPDFQQIQHFNFMDIVFEVVVLGVLGEARPQICPVAGGFLGHLIVMISSFSTTSEQITPWAAEHLHILKRRMILLLQDIFSMEERVCVQLLDCWPQLCGTLSCATWSNSWTD
ncbi:hypothetical protein SRHO_G00003900 [Serrasalmus rhombeus]